jgi:hypothetical protein
MSKDHTVYDLSNTGIAGLHLARGMDVRRKFSLLSCAVLYKGLVVCRMPKRFVVWELILNWNNQNAQSMAVLEEEEEEEEVLVNKSESFAQV